MGLKIVAKSALYKFEKWTGSSNDLYVNSNLYYKYSSYVPNLHYEIVFLSIFSCIMGSEYFKDLTQLVKMCIRLSVWVLPCYSIILQCSNDMLDLQT